MAHKYYAVRVGRIPGVYTSLDEYKLNTNHYSGFIGKGFNNETKAYEYIKQNKKGKTVQKNIELMHDEAIAYVDGSYSAKTGVPTYGIVLIVNNYENHFSGKVEDFSVYPMHNVAGELEAALRAMHITKILGIKKLTIYHDFIGLVGWYNGAYKKKKKYTQKYINEFENIKKYIDVKFIHVKSHSGDYYNNIADKLASEVQTNTV